MELQTMRELIDQWQRLEGRIGNAFPEMSAEERYQMCKRIMDKSLGIAETVRAGEVLQALEQA